MTLGDDLQSLKGGGWGGNSIRIFQTMLRNIFQSCNAESKHVLAKLGVEVTFLDITYISYTYV